MEQFELLRFVVGVLQEMGLRYFVTGSTATIFYGEPRFTNDIDVVVDLPPNRVREFCDRFPSRDFYVSEAAARDAVARKSQFNIIHPSSGLKVDVILPEPSAFNLSRFQRARAVRAAENLDVQFASPEDAILKKMEYFREGGSEKHLRDIESVLRISASQIDRNYIEIWAKQLVLEEVWKKIQSRVAGP
jgi:hypothetical protein